MNHPDLTTTQGALDWMLSKKMIIPRSTKDPETFATTKGYLLSDEIRERIGANLVSLLTKTLKKKELGHVTVKDAFLTATIEALLRGKRKSLTEDELALCANIIFALLPMKRFEQAGLADRPLRVVARNKALVEELRRIAASNA